MYNEEKGLDSLWIGVAMSAYGCCNKFCDVGQIGLSHSNRPVYKVLRALVEINRAMRKTIDATALIL